jgi:hypothetical protein
MKLIYFVLYLGSLGTVLYSVSFVYNWYDLYSELEMKWIHNLKVTVSKVYSLQRVHYKELFMYVYSRIKVQEKLSGLSQLFGTTFSLKIIWLWHEIGYLYNRCFFNPI